MKNTKEDIINNKYRVRKLHNKGLTPKEISATGVAHYTTVLRWCKEMGLTLQGSGGQNRKVNHNPFACNTPERDYWLGVIVGDGSVSNTVLLTSKDKEWLEDYISFIGVDLTIHKRKDCNTYQVLFSEPDTLKLLCSWGLRAPKAFTCTLPILNRHSIRGLFDADGTARKQVKITTGSKAMVSQLSSYLLKHNIDYWIKTKGNAFDVCIRATHHLDFYYLLYDNASIFLKRKKEDYVHLLGNKLEKISCELLEACNGNQQPSVIEI